MANIFNLNNITEDIKKFLSKFNRSDYSSVLYFTVLFGISVLDQYPQLNLQKIKSLCKSSQQVMNTEQILKALQGKIMELQEQIYTLEEKTNSIERFDKSTETESLSDNDLLDKNSSGQIFSKKKAKKVDFWNQTEEKENFSKTKTERTCWKPNSEINWMQDFSNQVKKIPKKRIPIVRESRISILSNQDKYKCSPVENFY
jgi:hypothetical protein